MTTGAVRVGALRELDGPLCRPATCRVAPCAGARPRPQGADPLYGTLHRRASSAGLDPPTASALCPPRLVAPASIHRQPLRCARRLAVYMRGRPQLTTDASPAGRDSSLQAFSRLIGGPRVTNGLTTMLCLAPLIGAAAGTAVAPLLIPYAGTPLFLITSAPALAAMLLLIAGWRIVISKDQAALDGHMGKPGSDADADANGMVAANGCKRGGSGSCTSCQRLEGSESRSHPASPALPPSDAMWDAVPQLDALQPPRAAADDRSSSTPRRVVSKKKTSHY